MAKIKSLKTDATRELNGVWQPYRDTDVSFLVARLSNMSVEFARRNIRRSPKAKAGQLTERESKELLAPALAKHVLLGWKNLQDDDGRDIPYSEPEALKLLLDPECHDIYDWIISAASDQNAFMSEADAGIAGNS